MEDKEPQVVKPMQMFAPHAGASPYDALDVNKDMRAHVEKVSDAAPVGTGVTTPFAGVNTPVNRPNVSSDTTAAEDAKTAEIERLAAENADLRAQLEQAAAAPENVEPPTTENTAPAEPIATGDVETVPPATDNEQPIVIAGETVVGKP